jgi:hypothetical protein
MKTYFIDKPSFKTIYCQGGLAIEFTVIITDQQTGLQDKIVKQLFLTDNTAIAFDQVEHAAIAKMSEYEQTLVAQE